MSSRKFFLNLTADSVQRHYSRLWDFSLTDNEIILQHVRTVWLCVLVFCPLLSLEGVPELCWLYVPVSISPRAKKMGPVSERKDTYVFFPNVRLRTRWFGATHYITQMVTGHGAFKEGLHRLGLTEDSRCSCPLWGPETPEHILYECTKYNSIRDRLRECAERVLQRLRGVCGQDNVTETGRRATPQTIVDIVRNRTLK